MRRLISERLLWLWCFGSAGCEFPVSSSKYYVAEGESSAGRADGANDGVELDHAVQALVRAFAGDDEACATAFADSCARPLAECGARSGCAEYGVCMRERATPTAETTCSDHGRTSIEDSWRFELLRHCWATRYAECNIGYDFSCVGAYGPPSGDRTAVEVRQQLLIRGTENAPSDFTVAFCPEWSDCSEPVVEVVADAATGLYDVSLPVGGKNAGVGNDWNGYRLIRGGSIPDSVIAANVPLWGRRVEITRLLDTSQVTLLAAVFGVDALRSAFVQVVDCQSDPAPGISFEVPSSPAASVGYVNEEGARVEGPTVSSGAAGISDYDSGEPQTIRALRGDELVAVWDGELSAGKVRYLRLHPRGRP
ncbi:MAG TPA: hypothetical protein VGK73_10525 [Polyangiaceae bacterium]